jgi:hypothetical protein
VDWQVSPALENVKVSLGVGAAGERVRGRLLGNLGLRRRGVAPLEAGERPVRKGSCRVVVFVHVGEIRVVTVAVRCCSFLLLPGRVVGVVVVFVHVGEIRVGAVAVRCCSFLFLPGRVVGIVVVFIHVGKIRVVMATVHCCSFLLLPGRVVGVVV